MFVCFFTEFFVARLGHRDELSIDLRRRELRQRYVALFYFWLNMVYKMTDGLLDPQHPPDFPSIRLYAGRDTFVKGGSSFVLQNQMCG